MRRRRAGASSHICAAARCARHGFGTSDRDGTARAARPPGVHDSTASGHHDPFTAETMVRTFARFLVLVTYGPLSIEIASKPGTFSHVHTNQQPPPSARCARRTFLTSYRDQSSASPPGMYVRGLDFLPRRFYQASINPKANHALDDDSLSLIDFTTIPWLYWHDCRDVCLVFHVHSDVEVQDLSVKTHAQQ
ncbi:hypothetical protein C8R46DRAFT_1210209 [Mycena filopes]|nr:hypothetical protein C8R46DRAFT_1210209 [Mycena filopes]